MRQFIKIFGMVMVLLYAGTGITLLTVPDFVSGFTGTARYMMGTLLLLYGGYRGYRVLKSKDYDRTEN